MSETRLKYVASITYSGVDKKTAEGEIPVRLCNYTDVYNNSSITADLDFMIATASGGEARRFALLPGDILITKDSETPEDIGVPAQVATKLPGVICGYHLALIRPDQTRLLPRYLYWCIASEKTRQHLASEANGVTRFGLRQDAVELIPIELPTPSRQQEVVSYLDRETRRIDEVISVKSHLRALAVERFFALIDELVGDLPETVPLKWVAQVRYGLGQPPPTSPEGVPIIRATNIKRGRIEEADLLRARLGDLPLTRAPLLQEGEIIVVRSGAYTGDSAIVFGKWVGAAPGYDLRVTPRTVNAECLAFQFLGRRVLDQIDAARVRAAQPHLNADDLAALVIRRGSSEQERVIAARLAEERGRLEGLVGVLDAQLPKLAEFRRAVITSTLAAEASLAAA